MRIKLYLSPSHPSLFLLMAMLLSLPMTGCKDQTSIEKAKALEEEVAQQQQLATKAKQDAQRLDAKLEGALRDNAALKEQNTKLESERDAKTKDLERLRKEFDDFKVRYKLGMAKRVPGMRVADFSVDGIAYHNVVLKDMNETQISFSHQDGVRKMALNILPEHMRDMLGLTIQLPVQETKAAMAPEEEKALRVADHQYAVSQAEDERLEVLKNVDSTRHRLAEAKQQLYSDTREHKQTKDLEKKIENIEKELVKLEGQKATAEIKLYQARQEASKNIPTR